MTDREPFFDCPGLSEQLAQELVPLVAAKPSFVGCQKRGSSSLAHTPADAGITGEECKRRDQGIDIARRHCEATTRLPDRIGSLAMFRADEDRRAAGSHDTVEFARHHDPGHFGPH
jgi:hypothetical protein